MGGKYVVHAEEKAAGGSGTCGPGAGRLSIGGLVSQLLVQRTLARQVARLVTGSAKGEILNARDLLLPQVVLWLAAAAALGLVGAALWIWMRAAAVPAQGRAAPDYAGNPETQDRSWPPQTQSVAAFYGATAQREWERLGRDAFHRLELDTTLAFLKKHLPSVGRILDAGGGPGRYTIELARQGYRMVLLDLTPELLAIAESQIHEAGVEGQVDAIAQGNLVDLSRFADGSFDAVLCLGGALGHLEGEADRQKALTELVRVVRPGGVVCVSVIGRLAVLAEAPRYWPATIEPEAYRREAWRDGDDRLFAGKTYAHFFLPEEFGALVEEAGLEISERVGLEGLSSHFWEEVSALFTERPKAWEHWLETHYHYCTHPAVVGMSGHMLIIGRKRV